MTTSCFLLVPFQHIPVPRIPMPQLTQNSSGSSSGSNAGNGGDRILFDSQSSDFGSDGMCSTINTKFPLYNDGKPEKLSSNQGTFADEEFYGSRR